MYASSADLKKIADLIKAGDVVAAQALLDTAETETAAQEVADATAAGNPPPPPTVDEIMIDFFTELVNAHGNPPRLVELLGDFRPHLLAPPAPAPSPQPAPAPSA